MAQRMGSPVWIDLGSNNVEGAAEFYRKLFGWNYTKLGPELGGYLMVDSGGAAATPVGGIGPNVGMDGTPVDQPAAWTVYLAVEDVQHACAEVTAHGGMVHVPPMPVGEMGQMAIVGAPSGAAFGLWQAAGFAGIEFTLEPGTPVWFEAMTLDFPRDAEFYAVVFGWENVPMAEDPAAGAQGEGGADGSGASAGGAPTTGGADSPGMPDNQGGYVTNFAQATAGLCEANAWLPAGSPSYWRLYFRVTDVDAAVERIQALGGSLLDGPIDSPFGRLATVADPDGASFQVIADPAG